MIAKDLDTSPSSEKEPTIILQSGIDWDAYQIIDGFLKNVGKDFPDKDIYDAAVRWVKAVDSSTDLSFSKEDFSCD